ncbi:MAG: hypothetical protein ABR954_08265 [Dehalococcoidales bacterium]
MDKIPIWMDLIAGIFLALDLFRNYKIPSKIYDQIKKFVKKIDTNNFTSFKSIIFTFTLSLFVFIILLLWVYYTNRTNLDYNVWGEIGWFTLGIVIAWGVITLLAFILKRKGARVIFAIGSILTVLSLFLFLLHPTNEWAATITSFAYICFLYPFGMIIAETVKKFLLHDEKRPFYMFAVIGLILFVISKRFELNG